MKTCNNTCNNSDDKSSTRINLIFTYRKIEYRRKIKFVDYVGIEKKSQRDEISASGTYPK